MRRMCSVLLVLTLMTASLYAQSESTTESMTEEQLEEFNRNRLTADVGIAFSGGWGVVTANRKCTGRQGFEKLSEAQFYEIAGYPEQAEKAAKYKTIGWALVIGRGAMFVGGSARSEISPPLCQIRKLLDFHDNNLIYLSTCCNGQETGGQSSIGS